jgi:predicted lipid-binding transport protein (Tim44 family)
MRMGFGLVGLLLALLLVAVLVKREMSAMRVTLPPAAQTPAAPGAAPVTVREQSKQIEQQVKQQMDALMQQSRDVPEDSK